MKFKNKRQPTFVHKNVLWGEFPGEFFVILFLLIRKTGTSRHGSSSGLEMPAAQGLDAPASHSFVSPRERIGRLSSRLVESESRVQDVRRTSPPTGKSLVTGHTSRVPGD